MAKVKIQNNDLLNDFKKECYLIDFEREYGKNHGISARWGLATNLSECDLEQKYGDLITQMGHRPYVTFTEQFADPYAVSKRNDKKFGYRTTAIDDAFGINENSEAFHPEMTYSMETERFKADAVRAVYANLSILTKKQQYVFHLYFDYGLSVQEIAARLGVKTESTEKVIDRILDRISVFSEKRRRKEAV